MFARGTRQLHQLLTHTPAFAVLRFSSFSSSFVPSVMLARSFITRKYADWKGADLSRSTRSAAVGPPTANNRNDDDLESQAAVATIVPDAVASTTIPEQANADVDADPRLNGVEAQMSVPTFLKIVSP